ncbi:MAG: hypothetical protein NTX50_10235 [Candidatus Sumerlaeota bacterium]|nr:hypothetical protein [Candidatus Sumerlaeota bacterium]
MNKTAKRIFSIGCGCLSVILVGGLIVGWIFYARILKPAKELEKIGRVSEQTYKVINGDFPFRPPFSGQLDEKRFQEYLAIRAAAAAAADANIEKLERALKRSSRELAIASLLNEGFVDTIQKILDAHQAALREHKMSASEYQWITRAAMANVLQAADKGNSEAQSLSAYYMGEGKVGAQVQMTADEKSQLRQNLESQKSAVRDDNLRIVLSHKSEITSPAYAFLLDLMTAGVKLKQR